MSYIHDSGLSTSAHPPADLPPAEQATARLLLADYDADELIRAGEAIARELPGCLSANPDRPLYAAAVRAGITVENDADLHSFAVDSLAAYQKWLGNCRPTKQQAVTG